MRSGSCSAAATSRRCRSTSSWPPWSPIEGGELVMADLDLDEATWKRRLDDGALEMGVQLDESQVDLLWRYGVMLRERNEHVNLTSIVSPEGILTLHILDSLSVA